MTEEHTNLETEPEACPRHGNMTAAENLLWELLERWDSMALGRGKGVATAQRLQAAAICVEAAGHLIGLSREMRADEDREIGVH